ncbi:type I restriction-modification system subunit M [Limosilactobacillus caviae]|uniref:site-specific DNA-methyltransferase (adenine-specific) n=1 Tax=Limosilactobacillus caviae TaxID=1769424 RepID=A0ABQ2C7Y8_9LACO|nr:type I restriction-modification system subunit M [Limosilactobacillus caviae]MCD7124052.1 type I restriction-modification system subunit M [Limosilactobacillus caviae]MRH47195.1 type I restriction-modification system subunit M [Limosilactobacillus reuteri]GGI64180.1 type I restriction-modification system subunit M [Limosilactobacillus caviae]
MNKEKIVSQLWEVEKRLKNNMDANEYQNYVLAFLFYRYLSERQEKCMIKSGLIDVVESKNINKAYKKQAEGTYLNDYLTDITHLLGYAIGPEYTWASIISRVNANKLTPSYLQDMLDSFNYNLKLNKDNTIHTFDGILDDMKLGNVMPSRIKAIADIISFLDEIKYKDEKGEDNLGDLYTYLIQQFAMNSGKKASEFYTPHEISEVLAKIVTIDLDPNIKNPEVYDFACGSGSLLLTVQDQLLGKNLKYSGQEVNTATYNLARMNLLIHDISYQNIMLKNGDTLRKDWPEYVDEHGINHPCEFDMVVANPPYSARWNNEDEKLKDDPRFKMYGALAPKTKADYAFLLHGLYHLKQDGTMAIILPHGVLFRGAKEAQIRKILLENNQIDTIIGLPANLLYSTGIPVVIIVLKKHKNNRNVLFIDASRNFAKGKKQNFLRKEDIKKIINTYKRRKDIDKYAHVASLDEIEENDYNLNIPRYVDTFEPTPPVDLGKLRKEMKDTQREIEENRKEILKIMRQLDI